MSTLSPPDFLLSTLKGIESKHEDNNNAFVTLTFAQSLDGKIAGVGGQQLILSGKESMVMTHWMRTMHDAIMIGIGTAVNDDPQLNTRHLPLPQNGQIHPLPRPVILDTDLRLPLTCKLLKNYAAGSGRQPWLVTRTPASSSINAQEWNYRRSSLEEAGARVILVEDGISEGYITVPSILSALRREGIRSIMVEGGARVIQSFLALPSLVDRIIVTVAPTFVGQAGLGYDIRGEISATKVEHMAVFGQDMVTALSFANLNVV